VAKPKELKSIVDGHTAKGTKVTLTYDLIFGGIQVWLLPEKAQKGEEA
jgi:hypothetical protein